jgi:hypothetical protein
MGASCPSWSETGCNEKGIWQGWIARQLQRHPS